jgi:rhodanese-related sulfurtransferase
MGPFASAYAWGTWTVLILSFVIGIGFGAALEMAGFGDSRKLTGQFYLRDMTVLKVMFGAVITAAVLLGVSSSLGLIDMSQVFVNPTYLWSGIVGGLVMGVGFMLGGFCPGTSLVAAATLKLDGIVFFLGVAIGIFLFGETLPLVQKLWLSGSYGRLTLPAVFGVSTGVFLLVVVAVGLGAFALAELAEARMGDTPREARLWPRSALGWSAAGLLVLGAVVAAAVGEPTAEKRWARIAPVAGGKLADRSVYVHPYEVAEVTRNTDLYTVVIDVRPEPDFNLFHLKGSVNLSLAQVADPATVARLAARPQNTVFFTVSWDETAATEAWRRLVALGLPNAYIIEGGINNWHRIFPPPPCLVRKDAAPAQAKDDHAARVYLRAVGDCCNTAYPEVAYKQIPVDCFLEMMNEPRARSSAGEVVAPGPPAQFTRKVKLIAKKAVSGGCS